MNRSVLSLIAASIPLALYPLSAQAGTTSGVVSTLMRMENAWVGALAKRDTKTLDSILGDRYVDGDETGARTNKQGVVSAIRSGDLKIKSVTLSRLAVNLYDDTAIVTGNALQLGSYKGTPLRRNVVFTDTFILRNGQWKAIASQRAPRL